MDQELAINIAQNALMMVLYIAAPLLGVSLIVGFAVSVFQATTQIHEQTLSFIPKILSVIITLAVLGTWMLNTLTDYTVDLYENILQFIR
ncbi:MAG: flagellar biosynthesis protein FliQ [Bacillota bacterium]